MPTRSEKGWCTWHGVSRISCNHGSHARTHACTALTHYITRSFVLHGSFFFFFKEIKTFANLKEKTTGRLATPQTERRHPIIRSWYESKLFCSVNHFAASSRKTVFPLMVAARELELSVKTRRVHICNSNSIQLSLAAGNVRPPQTLYLGKFLLAVMCN